MPVPTEMQDLYQKKLDGPFHEDIGGCSVITGSNNRRTNLQKCAVVPRRARIQGSQTFVSLNERLESRNEEEEPATTTIPQSRTKPSFLSPLICTAATPDSGEVQCKWTASKTRIWSLSEGWLRESDCVRESAPEARTRAKYAIYAPRSTH